MGFYLVLKRALSDTGDCLGSTVQAALLHPDREREWTAQLEVSL